MFSEHCSQSINVSPGCIFVCINMYKGVMARRKNNSHGRQDHWKYETRYIDITSRSHGFPQFSGNPLVFLNHTYPGDKIEHKGGGWVGKMVPVKSWSCPEEASSSSCSLTTFKCPSVSPLKTNKCLPPFLSTAWLLATAPTSLKRKDPIW